MNKAELNKEVNSYNRMITLNQENAHKLRYKFQNNLREENFGEAMFCLKKYANLLTENVENARIIGQIVEDYSKQVYYEELQND